jgi:protein SCO1/2
LALAGCKDAQQAAGTPADANGKAERVGASASAGSSGVAAKPLKFFHTDVTGSSLKPELGLADASGSLRTLADYQGKTLLVFFGFTQCPDVCPTTLQEAAEALRLLPAEKVDQVQVAFVTLDPARDQPAMLDAYVKAFHPSFIALRGSEEDTRRVAKSFRVYYERTGAASGSNYSIDHTAASFVFDPRGALRLYVRHAQGAKPLAADLAQL